MPMSHFLQRLFNLDLRALAFFRMGLACLLICDLFNRSLFLRDHYTKDGLLPLPALFGKFYNSYHFSLNFINDSFLFQAFLFFIFFASSCCLLFGYRTKVATILCWVFIVSLQNRNPMVLQAGDTLLRLLLFWSIFLPLGAFASVDAAMGKGKVTQKTIGNTASFAILFQVATLYLMTGLLKTSPEWWPNLTASLKALHMEQFTTNFGLFIRQFEGFIKAGTAVVYVLELLAFLLLFSPFWMIRLFGALTLMGMHLGFALSMRLGLFPFTDIVSLILFLPSQVWDQFESKTKDRQEQTIAFYDGDCGFCRKLVKVISHLLFVPNIKIKEAQSDEHAFELMERSHSWVLRTDSGENLQEFEGIIALVSLSPYFRFFTWLLNLFVIKWLGTLAYRLVANNRGFFGKLTRKFLREAPPINLRLGWLSSALVLLLSGLCLVWNLAFLPQIDVAFPML